MVAISEQPLWQRVAAQLREEINSDRYVDGDPFPTGAEIADEYGVSQTTTVRRAVEMLEREGLLTEGHGRLGRKVRKRKPYIHNATRSESAQRIGERKNAGVDAWVADVAEQGGTGSQDISVAVQQAPPEVAARLELKDGEPVVVRHRVRFIDGEQHNLNDTYYPESIAKGTEIMLPGDVAQGVISLMRDLGYVQVRYTDELVARMPTADEARRMRIQSGTVPVMVQYRTGYTADGTPVKLTVTVWPADRARIIWEFNA